MELVGINLHITGFNLKNKKIHLYNHQILNY